MKVKHTKKGEMCRIRAETDDGTVYERDFPMRAVNAIMKSQGLTEIGACEYIAVHHWQGHTQSPSARVTAPPPPAPILPPPKAEAAPNPPQAPKSIPPLPKASETLKKAPVTPIPPPTKDGDDMDDLLQELSGQVKEENEEGEDEEEEEEDAEEEEPTVEQWDDYNWLLEKARAMEYFARSGVQSRKKEDFQKYIKKKLK